MVEPRQLTEMQVVEPCLSGHMGAALSTSHLSSSRISLVHPRFLHRHAIMPSLCRLGHLGLSLGLLMSDSWVSTGGRGASDWECRDP